MKISVITPTIRPEGLRVVQQSLERQTLQDFEWLVEVGVPGRGHDLNAAFNRMLRRAKGELAVFYQDYIKIMDQGLERFWSAYQDRPRTFFTAPVGKVNDLEYTDQAKWDWRAFHPSKDVYEQCKWDGWEIDWACAPIAALKEIGGFDEELDQYWSCDNVNTGFRAELAGYEFKNLFSNPALAYDHDAFMEHPFRKKFNGSFNNMRISQFKAGLTLPPL